MRPGRPARESNTRLSIGSRGPANEEKAPADANPLRFLYDGLGEQANAAEVPLQPVPHQAITATSSAAARRPRAVYSPSSL